MPFYQKIGARRPISRSGPSSLMLLRGRPPVRWASREPPKRPFRRNREACQIVARSNANDDGDDKMAACCLPLLLCRASAENNRDFADRYRRWASRCERSAPWRMSPPSNKSITKISFDAMSGAFGRRGEIDGLSRLADGLHWRNARRRPSPAGARHRHMMISQAMAIAITPTCIAAMQSPVGGNRSWALSAADDAAGAHRVAARRPSRWGWPRFSRRGTTAPRPGRRRGRHAS